MGLPTRVGSKLLQLNVTELSFDVASMGLPTRVGSKRTSQTATTFPLTSRLQWGCQPESAVRSR